MRALHLTTTSKCLSKSSPNHEPNRSRSQLSQHLPSSPAVGSTLHSLERAPKTQRTRGALNALTASITPHSASVSFCESSSSRRHHNSNNNHNNDGSGNLTIVRLPSSDFLASTTKRPITTTPATLHPTTSGASSQSRTSGGCGQNIDSDSVASRFNLAASKTAKSSRKETLRLPVTTARPPLRSRDQNARHVAGALSSMSKSVKVTMPYDRTPTQSNGARPQLPTLSATAARGMNRTPITPKIASKPSKAPTLAVGARTPLGKTTQFPIGSNHQLKATPGQDDELPSYLINNITPRSGKRQSRVDSANSTPNGTPNPERTAEGWDRDVRSGLVASPSSYDVDAARKPAVTFSPIPSEITGQAKRKSQEDSASKFFYASDARTAPPQQPPPRPALAKTPSFFYANGTSAESRPDLSPPATSPQTQGNTSQDNLGSKFVFASGTPDLRPITTTVPSRPGSVVSTTSKPPTSRPGTGPHGSGFPVAQRPSSPVKLALSPQPAPLKHLNGPQIATSRSQGTTPTPLGTRAGLRRTSTGTSRGSHSRNSSLVLGEADSKAGHLSPGPASPSIAAALQPPPALTLASIIQAAEDFGEDENVTSADESRSELQSPTKSTHSVDPLNDLVANARRERKVQDLEITNASLEAINRTLERQLRKQTAEIRRYRRLSRSGRLSIASNVASSRVVSDSFSIGEGGEAIPLSALIEGISEDDEDDDEDEDDGNSSMENDSDPDSDSHNPSFMEGRDARHRRRDEKRLRLDLSKHQELLIDSQRINQSIKRCLDWTEELIKEGKKALEYKVRVSDVEIPRPRVLNPVDEEEDATQNNIPFDADVTLEDISDLIDETESNPTLDRTIPLEPKLAGWRPESDPPLEPMERPGSIELPPGAE